MRRNTRTRDIVAAARGISPKTVEHADAFSKGVAAIGIHDGIGCSNLSNQKEKPRTNPGLDKAGKTAIMKIEKGTATSG